MIKKIVKWMGVCGGIMIAAACSTANDSNTAQEEAVIHDAFASKIKTIKTVTSEQEKEFTLNGKVISDPDKTITYIPLVSGVVERTYFTLGDKVQKGQTLVDIRSSELNALQSGLLSLEAEVKIAERELRTAQSMYEDNMLSERDLLEAQSKVTRAQAEYNKTRQDVELFGGQKGNGLFSIKAPVSGYIIDKNASAGSTISPDSQPLFTIADLSTVWVTANVFAGNLPFVREGMEANITTLSYPNEIFTGKIHTISQVFDAEDRTLKARIILDNAGMKFKPEMSVVVRLKDATQQGLVTVPSDVVIFDDDAYHVVVDKGNSEYEIRQIIPYDHNSRQTYIASGLHEGEVVVSRNQLLIYSELKGK